MINPVTGEQVPELCENKDCRKYNHCLLKFRMNSCEFYNDFTCYDCIFKQDDDTHQYTFCTENRDGKTRLISDPWGQGEITICKKFRRLNHG